MEMEHVEDHKSVYLAVSVLKTIDITSSLTRIAECLVSAVPQ